MLSPINEIYTSAGLTYLQCCFAFLHFAPLRSERRGPFWADKAECIMGMSDPEARNKLSEARWLQFKHQAEKQSWPLWKRLMHRLEECEICGSEKAKAQKDAA